MLASWFLGFLLCCSQSSSAVYCIQCRPTWDNSTAHAFKLEKRTKQLGTDIMKAEAQDRSCILIVQVIFS